MLGRRVADVVSVQTPGGDEEWRIVASRYRDRGARL
jgi:transcription elongation GreA/GreB family factor